MNPNPDVNELYAQEVERAEHLANQYDVKCDELRDAHIEIARLQKLLIENNICFDLD